MPTAIKGAMSPAPLITVSKIINIRATTPASPSAPSIRRRMLVVSSSHPTVTGQPYPPKSMISGVNGILS